MNRCCCFILECGGLTPLFHVRVWLFQQSGDKSPHSKSLHRIISARAKWLAAKQSPNCHSASAHSARVVQLLRAHIRNKSERSGKTAATRARLLLGKTSKAKLK